MPAYSPAIGALAPGAPAESIAAQMIHRLFVHLTITVKRRGYQILLYCVRTQS